MSRSFGPDYPDDEDAPPRRRPRAALIVIAVVSVVAAGVALGLVVNSGDSDQDPAGPVIDPSATELRALDLPPGCELLTSGQVATLVPGRQKKVGRGPGEVLGATESACEWSNTETQPADPRVPPATLQVTATAAADERSARSTMETSRPCSGANSTTAVVTGADEACLAHEAADSGEAALVSARFQSLVVEVVYQRSNWPTWRVDDQSAVTAAALIGSVVRSQ